MSASGANAYIAIVKADPTKPFDMPATPVLQKLEFSKITIGEQIATTKSKNVSNGRRSKGAVITDISLKGDVESDMTFMYSKEDELILAAICAEKWDATTHKAKDGAFRQPFFMERGHPDINQYLQLFGVFVDTWEMDLKEKSSVEQKYSFIGLKQDPGTTPATGATYVDPPDNQVFSTVTHIKNIKIDGVGSGKCEVKDLSIKFDNHSSGKTGLGVMGACDVTAHEFDITGKMTSYLEDLVMYNRLKTGKKFSFEFDLINDDGKGYHYFFPAFQLLSDELPVDGSKSVFNNASFMATGDPTANCAVEITQIV